MSFPNEYYTCVRSTINNLPSNTAKHFYKNPTVLTFSQKKTYNQRSVSTLAVESMFSVLTTLSRATLGIPLAAKIPRYISKITQLNATQCNPHK